jgi:hypothetical protein
MCYITVWRQLAWRYCITGNSRHVAVNFQRHAMPTFAVILIFQQLSCPC